MNEFVCYGMRTFLFCLFVWIACKNRLKFGILRQASPLWWRLRYWELSSCAAQSERTSNPWLIDMIKRVHSTILAAWSTKRTCTWTSRSAEHQAKLTGTLRTQICGVPSSATHRLTQSSEKTASSLFINPKMILNTRSLLYSQLSNSSRQSSVIWSEGRHTHLF